MNRTISQCRHGDKEDGSRLVTLNFKVPEAFRREMKVFAAAHGTTMVNVLYEGFALLNERAELQAAEEGSDRNGALRSLSRGPLG